MRHKKHYNKELHTPQALCVLSVRVQIRSNIGSCASAMFDHGARSDGMLRYGATATSSCCLPPILEDQQLFPAARLIDMMIQS